MALNKHMHPRNIYRTPPDFKELALNYSEFRKYAIQDITGKVHINFKDTDTLRALTTTLLQKDFDLSVDIPKDRLVPTLPLRLNYLLWIEDLLTGALQYSKTTDVYGLDVGTGAICIYPLLGHRMNGWTFCATDSDDVALMSARRNVENNGLQAAITVKKASRDSILVETVDESEREFDFTMCNPPFFRDDVEADTASKGRSKSRPPPRANNRPCTEEAVTEGGEVAFISKLIEESVQIGAKVKIYTTMIGKKKSLALVKRKIQEVGGGVRSFTTTELCQGHTMRWGIAWTFRSDAKLEKITSKPKGKLSRPVGFIIPRQLKACRYCITAILQEIGEILRELEIEFVKLKVEEDVIALRLKANENSWSHQRRKRRAANQCKTNSDDSRSLKRAKYDTTTRDLGREPREEATTSEADASRSIETVEQMKSEPVLECFLFLRKVSENIVLEVQWVSGTLGKDAVHQILQYFKNKIV